MEWAVSGVWGDENMPGIEFLETSLFGTRETLVIDITEAIEYLGTIRSGRLYWESNRPEHSYVEVEYSIDGGKTFIKMPYRIRGYGWGALSGVHNDMELVIRTHLRFGLVDILPHDAVELYSLKVRLSDKPEVAWDHDTRNRLIWDEVIM